MYKLNLLGMLVAMGFAYHALFNHELGWFALFILLAISNGGVAVLLQDN